MEMRNSQKIVSNKYKIDDIYNVNCLELMSEMEDNSVDLIFADPPYNLSSSNYKIKFVKSGGADLSTNKGEWDKFKSPEEYEEFIKNWLTESFRILKDGGSIWVAGSYHNIYVVGYYLQKLGFTLLNEILWHKTDATPNLSCTRFVADHENFIWARKGKKATFNYKVLKDMSEGKQMRSIWAKGKTSGGKKIHPTQKPEWLLHRIIIGTSSEGNLIFDPFLGSGTTAVVAKKLNRHFLGAEINVDFYNLAKERIQKALL